MSAAQRRFNPSAGMAAVAVALSVLFFAGSASAAIQIESFAFETTDAGGTATQQASGHPDQVVTEFSFAEDADKLPLESPRNIVVDLPVGSVGIPTATPTCAESQLSVSACAPESQVGVIKLVSEAVSLPPLQFPIFNMKPQDGVLAQFGFKAVSTTVHMVAKIRSEPDYGVTITTRDLPQPVPYTVVRTVFWGVPADESHDEYREGFDPVAELPCMGFFGPNGGKCPSHPEKVLPFLTNPSACTATSIAVGHVDSWPATGIFASAAAGNLNQSGEPIGISGCDTVDFSPTLKARPTTNLADSPSGLEVELQLPQSEDPAGLAEAQLKDATITFPEGMTVNPASAAGLGACSPAQVGLTTPIGESGAHFNAHGVTCPDASRLGTVLLGTPVLPDPLQGNLYLASPHENPFGSLLALYMVVEDPATGALIKIPGEIKPDSQSGQLTVSFPRNPQLPFEDLRASLYPGSRAALKTPLACGQFTTTSEMVPWTAPEGATKRPSDSFPIVGGAGSTPCSRSEAEAPNWPSFKAGTMSLGAGAYSPFTLRLARADGTQQLRGIDATLPKGLLAKLAGIPYCSDQALASAAGKAGRAEQAASSCPAASKVGSVTVGAGAGPEPLYVGGSAYLAGPYKGAPLSLAVVTPAVAGPFDLGTVVVRSPLYVNPETAAVRVVSDPFPSILQGIPLDLRSVLVKLDKPSFTKNPTNCSPFAITGAETALSGQSVPLNQSFQVADCAKLRFGPKLALRLKGGTARSEHPALRAVLTAREGEAGIARTSVALPHSEFLAQSHINTVCTRVQFAAGVGNGAECPKGSIYGRAAAITPLLDQPLRGPLYLRSSNNSLPDLVAALHGQIAVNLVGRIDSVDGGIRTTFGSVPDAPVTKFVLQMQGGKKGLLENSRNLCRQANRATVQMDGQNDKISDSTPMLVNGCKKQRAEKHRRRVAR